MIVISDTSPVNYLVLIGQIEVLQKLFGKVVIPQAVMRELSHPRTPKIVAEWAESPPDWIEIKTVMRVEVIDGLGDGEVEAMMLAEELHADLVLLDDGEARDVAVQRGLKVTGILGVLEAAAAREFVDLRQTLQLLRQKTNCRISDALIDAALRRAERGASPRG